MKKVLLLSFILVISYLFSMKVTDRKVNEQEGLNTQEGIYLKQHTEIFPTPVQDYFNIESTDGVNIESFVVYNIKGKQIMFLSNETNSTIDIDTSTYNSGIYILQIASKRAIIFKKFNVVNN